MPMRVLTKFVTPFIFFYPKNIAATERTNDMDYEYVNPDLICDNDIFSDVQKRVKLAEATINLKLNSTEGELIINILQAMNTMLVDSFLQREYIFNNLTCKIFDTKIDIESSAEPPNLAVIEQFYENIAVFRATIREICEEATYFTPKWYNSLVKSYVDNTNADLYSELSNKALFKFKELNITNCLRKALCARYMGIKSQKNNESNKRQIYMMLIAKKRATLQSLLKNNFSLIFQKNKPHVDHLHAIMLGENYKPAISKNIRSKIVNGTRINAQRVFLVSKKKLKILKVIKWLRLKYEKSGDKTDFYDMLAIGKANNFLIKGKLKKQGNATGKLTDPMYYYLKRLEIIVLDESVNWNTLISEDSFTVYTEIMENLKDLN